MGVRSIEEEGGAAYPTGRLEKFRAWTRSPLAALPAFLPWTVLVLYSGFIFYMSSREVLPRMPRFPHADKVFHCGAYCAWALTCATAVYRSRPSWSLRSIALVAALSGAAYGITDEIHQAYVPGRSADVWDWAADSVGASLGGFCCAKWLRGSDTAARASR
ncbi:MAG: VanZ family protein [Planctomycetota bacterium]